jgi:hypothetical protein
MSGGNFVLSQAKFLLFFAQAKFNAKRNIHRALVAERMNMIMSALMMEPSTSSYLHTKTPFISITRFSVEQQRNWPE